MTDKPIGIKHDEGKLQWHLLPFREVKEIVRVLTFGANKYGPYNWRLVEPAKERYFSAVMRHLVAWYDGETEDKETTINHLAHAACGLLFLMWHDNEKKKNDQA